MNISSDTIRAAIDRLVYTISEDEFMGLVEQHRISDPAVNQSVEAVISPREQFFGAAFNVAPESFCTFHELPRQKFDLRVLAPEYEDLAFAA